MTLPKKTDVAIIGGGIAGLSTAYFLQQQAPAVGYTLLEQSSRWGGKIFTERVSVDDVGEFIVEGGPDAFITQKPWAMQLATTLGLEERLLPTNDEKRQIYVINKGKPTPMPDGVLLIVPTKFTPFALSPLISPAGKVRMGMDLFIKPKTDGEDETLADFITRRLGSEALDKIAEPLMSGIYNAEAERQSVLATFPRFRTLEEQHGSLIKGMLASRAQRSAATPSNGGKPKSVFMSMQDGMTELVSAVTAELTGDLRLETTVQGITEQEDGYLLTLNEGESLIAKSIVLAIPAHAAAKLLRAPAPAAANALEEIRYVSTGTISFAFREADIQHPLNGFGVVIPRSEGRAINAVTWTSTKFDHRAPAGAVLLRCFFGGSRRPDMMNVPDDELITIVRRELEELLGINAEPLFTRAYRWFDANPQYDVGHLDRVAAIKAELPDTLFVTGSPYGGVGIPDCIHQAEQTATEVAAALQEQTPAQ